MTSIDVLEIPSANGVRLTFSSPEPPTGPVDYFAVTMELAGIRAATRVYLYQVEDLARFFEAMAVESQGWEGRKQWTSIEDEFEMICTTDGLGHVCTQATLREIRDSGVTGCPGGWEAKGTLILEAGSLDRIARKLRRFLRL
jgi:hypothetical protein